MTRSRVLAACACVLGISGAAAVGWLFPARALEAQRALLIVPALLCLPGLGWARGAVHPLDRILRACVIATAFGIPLLAASVRLTDVGAQRAALFGGAAVFAALGWLRDAPRPRRGSMGERIGAALVIAACVSVVIAWRTEIRLPLDGNW